MIVFYIITIKHYQDYNKSYLKKELDSLRANQNRLAIKDSTKQIVYVDRLQKDTIYTIKYKTKVIKEEITKIVNVYMLDSNTYMLVDSGRWKLGEYKSSFTFKKDSMNNAIHNFKIKMDSLLFLARIYKEDGLLKASIKCNNPNLPFSIVHNIIDKSVYDAIYTNENSYWYNYFYIGGNIEVSLNKYEVKPKISIGYNYKGIDSYIYVGNKEKGVGGSYKYFLKFRK